MRSQLLEEVLAAPDDDGPRRIFGDYLAERGDPRGELIAVQCELAKASSPELVSREKALLDEHGATWLAELGLPPKVQIAQSIDHPRGSAVVFRRGFPEAAKLAVEDFYPRSRGCRCVSSRSSGSGARPLPSFRNVRRFRR